MGHTATIQCMPARFIGQHLNLIWIDDFLVINSYVRKEVDHVHFLLKVAAFQIRVGLSRDREDGRLIKLGIIKTIQQMNAAWSRGRKTTSEFACVFRIATRHKGGGLFMSDLNKTNLILASAQGFDDSVYAITGQSENSINSPVNYLFNENVRSGISHNLSFQIAS